MYTLTITTQDATTNITRDEQFDNVEAAADRRAFLKSIERFGSSNLYNLNETGSAGHLAALAAHRA
jgi:hypothetical protein